MPRTAYQKTAAKIGAKCPRKRVAAKGPPRLTKSKPAQGTLRAATQQTERLNGTSRKKRVKRMKEIVAITISSNSESSYESEEMRAGAQDETPRRVQAESRPKASLSVVRHDKMTSTMTSQDHGASRMSAVIKLNRVPQSTLNLRFDSNTRLNASDSDDDDVLKEISFSRPNSMKPRRTGNPDEDNIEQQAKLNAHNHNSWQEASKNAACRRPPRRIVIDSDSEASVIQATPTKPSKPTSHSYHHTLIIDSEDEDILDENRPHNRSLIYGSTQKPHITIDSDSEVGSRKPLSDSHPRAYKYTDQRRQGFSRYHQNTNAEDDNFITEEEIEGSSESFTGSDTEVSYEESTEDDNDNLDDELNDLCINAKGWPRFQRSLQYELAQRKSHNSKVKNCFKEHVVSNSDEYDSGLGQSNAIEHVGIVMKGYKPWHKERLESKAKSEQKLGPEGLGICETIEEANNLKHTREDLDKSDHDDGFDVDAMFMDDSRFPIKKTASVMNHAREERQHSSDIVDEPRSFSKKKRVRDSSPAIDIQNSFHSPSPGTVLIEGNNHVNNRCNYFFSSPSISIPHLSHGNSGSPTTLPDPNPEYDANLDGRRDYPQPSIEVSDRGLRYAERIARRDSGDTQRDPRPKSMRYYY